MENYIVQPGDTIASIAKLFDIKVVDLVKENGLENTYFLVPGLELIIPGATNQSSLEEYVVQKGDNLYQIALKYGIDDQTLAQINGLELNEYIYPEQILLVPREGFLTYITKENDTLNSIANDLDISKENILNHNQDLYLLPEQLIMYRSNN